MFGILHEQRLVDAIACFKDLTWTTSHMCGAMDGNYIKLVEKPK